MELPGTQSERIEQEIEWFAKHQSYLDRVAARATRYLYHVVDEVERRGLPTELALLPIVESAYQPFAHSPSGASGMWQFISSTGKRYGLKQNWWYDGRRDVVESTRAALDYLEKLHQEFDGDWLLAIAAYNAGEGNVAAAMERNEQAGKPTDFWSLDLRRETRKYVPSLLAVSKIVAEPSRFGLSLQTIDNKPYFSVVHLEGQMDLALAADLAGISNDEIYTLNPAFNRWATDPDGPHRLLLPTASTASFEAALSDLAADELVTWKRHEIRPGDTLLAIANENNTSVATLRQMNALESNVIRVGHSLIVPTSVRPLKEYTLSADARGVQPQLAQLDGRTKLTYTVRNGDNLWTIARRHDTRVEQLTRWNGIGARALLRPGQKLVIWRKGKEPVTDPSPMPVAQTEPNLRHVKYTVRHGDSLWVISQRFKVSVASLKRWNAISKGKLLHPGEQLDVYLKPGEFEI